MTETFAVCAFDVELAFQAAGKEVTHERVEEIFEQHIASRERQIDEAVSRVTARKPEERATQQTAAAVRKIVEILKEKKLL